MNAKDKPQARGNLQNNRNTNRRVSYTDSRPDCQLNSSETGHIPIEAMMVFLKSTKVFEEDGRIKDEVKMFNAHLAQCDECLEQYQALIEIIDIIDCVGENDVGIL